MSGLYSLLLRHDIKLKTTEDRMNIFAEVVVPNMAAMFHLAHKKSLGLKGLIHARRGGPS